MFDLTAWFSGKSWYKSLTAWGLVVFTAGDALVGEACALGLIGDETCATLEGWIVKVSGVLVGLGLRRAIAPPA